MEVVGDGNEAPKKQTDKVSNQNERISKFAQNDKNPADLPFRLGGRCSWEQRVCRSGGKPDLEGELSMDLDLDLVDHSSGSHGEQ